MANLPYKPAPSQRVAVSSLLSPPEMKRSESFGSSIPSPSFVSAPLKPTMEPQIAAYDPSLPSNRHAYASPPISPFETQSQKENMQFIDEQEGARDPQLFAASDATASITTDVPLFPKESVGPIYRDIISEHMDSPAYAHLKSKPTREEYELVVDFHSTVFGQAFKNPRSWWRQERRFDNHYGQQSSAPKRQALKALAPAPSSRSRPPKIPLSRAAPRANRVAKPKRTPKLETYDTLDFTMLSTSPKAVRPATNRDDVDYNALHDYSPSFDTLLKGNNKRLKAEWKGTVLNLSNDPDRHMLHEAEVTLAATLRLSCATYLCSKRRIFEARVEALKNGKEFRKTTAQQSCKIDVNKASKLWTAFSNIGAFEPELFRHCL